MRLLALAAVLLFTTGTAAARADYYQAEPQIVVRSNGPFTPTFMYWCNTAFHAAGDDYEYFSAVLVAAGPTGTIKCVFYYQDLNPEHYAGTLHTWASVGLYGDPMLLADGSRAEGDVVYP